VLGVQADVLLTPRRTIAPQLLAATGCPSGPQPKATAARLTVAEEVGALRQPAGERLSVLDEVLRSQARHRPPRRAGLAALLLLGVFAVPWLGPSTRPSVAGTGAVTGYIQPCSGLGFPVDTSTGARLFSAAAVVEARPGHEYQKPVGDGIYRVVFPAGVAARERVAQNQQFRLDHLAPGRYVILAQYAGGSGSTSVEVSVAPGQATEVDLPNTCK
jgi:hypothetical protein